MAFPFYQYTITPNNLVYSKLYIQYGLKHFLSLIGKLNNFLLDSEVLSIQFQSVPNMILIERCEWKLLLRKMYPYISGYSQKNAMYRHEYAYNYTKQQEILSTCILEFVNMLFLLFCVFVVASSYSFSSTSSFFQTTFFFEKTKSKNTN